MRHVRFRGTLRRAGLGGRIDDAIAMRILEVAARRAPLAARDELRLAGGEIHRVLLITTGADRGGLEDDLRPVRSEIRLRIFAAKCELTDVFEVLLAVER